MTRSIGTWLGFALLCAGAGCTTHMTAVRPLPPEKEAEINGMVAGRDADLTIEGEHQKLVGKDVRLAGTTVRFQERRAAEWLPEAEKPLASLRQIEVSDHGHGALQGLGIGAGIGAVAGLIASVVYVSTCTPPECHPIFVLGGAAAATFGFGLLGAALGGAIGAPRVIEFKDAPSH